MIITHHSLYVVSGVELNLGIITYLQVLIFLKFQYTKCKAVVIIICIKYIYVKNIVLYNKLYIDFSKVNLDVNIYCLMVGLKCTII